MKQRHSQPGQSLPEYALAIGLVTLVATIGLTSMGGEINGFFSTINTSLASIFGQDSPSGNPTAPNTPMKAAPESPILPGVLPGNAMPTWVSAALAKLPPSPPGTQPVCFNRMCVNMPVIDDTNDAVDTVGGNGAQKVYAFSDALEQLAQQLAQDPNSDPILTQLVSKLANTGHGIGDQHTLFSQQCPNTNCAGETPNTLRAKSDAFDTAKRQIDTYLAAHPDSLNASAQSVIQSNSTNIQKYDITRITTPNDTFILTGVNGSTTNTWIRYDSLSTLAPLVHQSANTICAQGGKDCYVPVPSSTATDAGQSR